MEASYTKRIFIDACSVYIRLKNNESLQKREIANFIRNRFDVFAGIQYAFAKSILNK